MDKKSKAMLESKLTVYLTFYQEAEKKNDKKRMDEFGTYISDLREEIHASK